MDRLRRPVHPSTSVARSADTGQDGRVADPTLCPDGHRPIANTPDFRLFLHRKTGDLGKSRSRGSRLDTGSLLRHQGVDQLLREQIRSASSVSGLLVYLVLPLARAKGFGARSSPASNLFVRPLILSPGPAKGFGARSSSASSLLVRRPASYPGREKGSGARSSSAGGSLVSIAVSSGDSRKGFGARSSSPNCPTASSAQSGQYVRSRRNRG